jgi:tousled-like kinase
MGVIFYQMLYGRRPFGESQTQEQILQTGTMLGEQTRAGPQVPERPAVSRAAQDFIKRCLTYSADARPDVLATCRDPYLLQGPDSRASAATSGRRGGVPTSAAT